MPLVKIIEVGIKIIESPQSFERPLNKPVFSGSFNDRCPTVPHLNNRVFS